MRLCVAVACTFLLAACGGSSASSAPAAPSARGEADNDAGPAWRRSCEDYAAAPVEIAYQDASGGAAVIYLTKGDVDALRERTAEVARFHNSGAAKGPVLHDLASIPHNARVESMEGGAKLVLTPKRLSLHDLEALRRNVQQEVLIMQKRGCGRGQEAL